MVTTDENHEFTQAESTWTIDAMDTFAIIDQQSNPFKFDNRGEDDAWISSLLPMTSTALSSSSSSPMKICRKKDTSLHANDEYKQAYQKISVLSTEHLSNEEWTARRLQRERKARSHRQVSRERNQPVQQYYRSDQRGLEDSWSVARNNSLVQELLLSQGEGYPHRNHNVSYRESLIDRSRSAVSNTIRFLGSLSRNNREAAPRSHATTSPTWVGRGGTGDSNRPDRTGLESMTGISSRRRRRTEIRALYDDDESDDDTAYWTTGTAMESNSSFRSEPEEVESVPSTEEHQMDNVVQNEFLEWNYCPEAQQGDQVPAFPHDPFVQFKF
mmetsp:Transcript_9362/g.22167  ORF Transcript_9362/g.22167 Transcript_9362/m.22167 type:complete len:328 (-) Transcript_9362:26-1009(-)